MTADDAGTRLGAEIEFVVDPPIPETQPGAVVDGIMTQMENIVGLMIPFQTQQRFMLNQATGSAQDATVEVYPTIKGQAQATNMPSNPQVTGGIRLDKMGELFQDIVAAHGQDNANPRYQALQAAGVENYVRMLHTENQGMLGAANTRAGQYQHPATPFAPGPATSAKFKGLIALAMTYLWTARNGYQGGALPYAKAFTLLLGRTDFAAMWNSLPGWERAIYNGRPHEFSARTLAAAGNLPPGDRLLTRGVMNVPNQPQQGTHHIPITRQDWLIGIAQGVDRLSVAQFPHLEGEFESLGHLGAKTDAVGPGGNQQGVVAEFRKVQQQMPYLGWRPFANAIFTYLRTVNQ